MRGDAPVIPGTDSASRGTRRYRDPGLGLDVVILLPGYLYVSHALEYISTVLGTCIAVCLYDREHCFGGMNHFLLPRHSGPDRLRGPGEHRYGEDAMPRLLATMESRGSHREHLEASVLGGAAVQGDRLGIGSRNRDFARECLAGAGIPIRREDTGGIHPRQVLFDVHFGHVRVRNRRALAVPAPVEKERRFVEDALKPEHIRSGMPRS